MTVAYSPQTRALRTDSHAKGDQLINVVVTLGTNQELSILLLTTATAREASTAVESTSTAADAIYSPQFE